jgi:dTDP-glucose 4,6-dehydratase
MNILVTGGAGFIGSNLVHYLLRDAAEELRVPIDKVVTLDKLTYAGNRSSLADLDGDPRHVFVQGDICDETRVAALLRDHDIDAVMHLAAESHVDRSIDGPEAFIMTNVVGTFRLLDAFRKYLVESGRTQRPNYGKPIADGGESVFLHVSTDEVFGSLGPEDPMFCESTPYAPNSPYSASKAGSDHLARAYHHTYGMPVITTNCSNNYGPFQFPEKLLPLMIQKTLRGEALPVYGDGTNIRDWLYVEDHCRGLATALVRGTIGETYVIGGKNEIRNIDVVRALIRCVHELAPACATRSPDELITFVKDRPGHDQRYAIDPARIENELGWSPRESFETGLRKTVSWYLENTGWLAAIENGSYRGERLGTLA